MGNCFKKQNKDEELLKPFINSTTFKDTIDEDFSEYFNMIRLKVSKFYQENQNNQFNISISLDKKDFNQSSLPKRITLDPNEKYIYWKDYLIDYLSKQSSVKEPWAIEMLERVEDEIFLKENKWLSLFFWQEFELRTRPPNIGTNETDENPFIKQKEEEEINQISERLRLHSNLSEKFHYVGNKEGLDDVSQEESNNNPQTVYKEYRKKVKSYIQIFNQHISDNEHPINIIIKYFVNSFSKHLKTTIEEIKKLKKEHCVSINDKSSVLDVNDYSKHKPAYPNWDTLESADNSIATTIKNKVETKINSAAENREKNQSKLNYDQFVTSKYNSIVKSLQKFILKLQTSLRLMYAKTINYQCFIEEKDEFINLICNLIFKTGSIYDLIYELFFLTNLHDFEELQAKMKMFEHVKPEDLSIKAQFCLNEKTVELQKNIGIKNKNMKK